MPVLRPRGITRAGRADFCPSVGVTVPYPRPRSRRRPASERGESARNGLTPGPHGLVSFPSLRTPRAAEVGLQRFRRARRWSLSSSETGAFRTAFTLRLRLPPLGGPVSWSAGITPTGPASRNGGFHRDRLARENPGQHRLEGSFKRLYATSTVGIAFRRDREVHDRREPVRSPSVPDRSGGRAWLAGPYGPPPKEFVDQSTPRGIAPTPRRGRNRRGCRSVYCRGLMPSPAEQGA
jgi:hypothetical protein